MHDVKSYTIAKVFSDIFEDMAKYAKYPSSFKVSSGKSGGSSATTTTPSTPTENPSTTITPKPKSETVQTANSAALTIKDILYKPYGCLPKTLYSEEEAKRALTEKFGRYERINSIGTGLHNASDYNYTYNNVPIGLCYIDWYGEGGKPRSIYYFFVQTKDEADELFNSLVKDIRQAGIPMTRDNSYGEMSNRKKPTKTFKVVAVKDPEQVIKKDWANIVNDKKWVGMYKIEVNVFIR